MLGSYEKTINVCDVLDALIGFEVNDSDNTGQNTNQSPNNEEKKEDFSNTDTVDATITTDNHSGNTGHNINQSPNNEDEKKEDISSGNPFGAVDSRKNIHKIELNQETPRERWFYTDPDRVFPISIWEHHAYEALLKEDPKRKRIYRLAESTGL